MALARNPNTYKLLCGRIGDFYSKPTTCLFDYFFFIRLCHVLNFICFQKLFTDSKYFLCQLSLCSPQYDNHSKWETKLKVWEYPCYQRTWLPWLNYYAILLYQTKTTSSSVNNFENNAKLTNGCQETGLVINCYWHFLDSMKTIHFRKA